MLVCSAWPYASGVPHLGNMVGSLLSGDVFARYYRLRGKKALYVSGSDAHGTRIEYEAKKAGMQPEELVHKNHQRICDVLDGFSVQFDNYTTTMTETHRKFVQGIYLRMEENGHICTKEEQRAYCLHDQKFLADRLISGTCPKCGSPGALGNQCDACGAILEPEELVNPVCNFCGLSEIEFRHTKHWYLDLAGLSEQLESYVASRGFQGNVAMFTRRMIDEGLRPRAMTRDIDWGIPAPFKGAEGKVIYVWGEAALGYVSSVIEHFGGDPEWREFWFGDDVFQVYTVGKDNIPFHTLIFPGQLIASGEGYHLPDQIAATEYLNWIGGDSFSKSRGVGLYCDDALKVLDGELWRFYLLYNRPEGRDVNFSWEELEKAINGVLISNIANLMNRIISFVQSKYDKRIPTAILDAEVVEALATHIGTYETAMHEGSLQRALRVVCDLAVFGNEYFQRKKPWATHDESAVASAIHLVKAMAILLKPTMPGFSSTVLGILGLKHPAWSDLDVDLSGQEISDERALLERIEIDDLRAKVESIMSTDEESPEPAEAGTPMITFDDFGKLDLRVAKILEVNDIPKADRLYRLTVDLGDETRTCVAGIKASYKPEELIGQSIVVVANLEPVTLRGVQSECMLLAAKGEQLSLVGPARAVDPGTTVS